MSSEIASVLARWLLTTYPQIWRARYGDEVATIIEQGVTYHATLDLARGAVDAWLLELASSGPRAMQTTVAMLAYVTVQLIVFAALRANVGPGRFDVAAMWAIGYAVGFFALYYALARRRPRAGA